MKSNMFILTLLFIIFLGSVDVYPESVRGVTDTTIKIGVIMDLTGPSAGDVGQPLTAAFKNYTRYVNDNGGIFGRKVKLIIEDDRYSIPITIATFKKLLFKDQIFALIGPSSVGGNKVLFKQLTRYRVPNITVAPGKEMVRPLQKYTFLPVNLYDDQVGVIYDYIVNNLNPERIKITFAYPDAESGKDVLASARKWASFFKVDFNTEIVNLGTLDASTQAMSIKKKQSTHVVVHHGAPGMAMVLRDLRKFGLDMPVFGTMPAFTEDTVKMARNASRNCFGAQPFTSWNEDTEGCIKMRKIASQAAKVYPSGIYVVGWVASMILYEGLERAGRDLSIGNLITGLESIRDFDTKGLCGPINFSPTDHQGLYHSKLYKADPERGRLIPISDWRKAPETRQ
ncbi:MAG: ABC transporter substrate-binding protein [Thermodesulfobacteriota bacterium]|nr:ABC transporter substrate-binding protein [Thermodesulfobacteriota bacterium]